MYLVLDWLLLKQDPKMVAINVQVKGINKEMKFWVNLPPNLRKEIRKSQKIFMRDIQKSAKLRAPRWTGKLARSIIVKELNKNTVMLTVNSPYGAFQELGFKPHYVELRRSTRSGHVVADWAATKGVKGQTGSIFVSKFKPFIRPALEMNLSRLSQKLILAAELAEKRS